MQFVIADYEGVEVSCTREKWQSKIAGMHPELGGQAGVVRGAIADPDLVVFDRDYPNRKHHLQRRSRRGLFVKVVVEYRFSGGEVTGRVVTAYLTDRVRDGDTVTYVRPRRR